jgi:hypothetical protein
MRSFLGSLLYARNKIIIFEKVKIRAAGNSFVNIFIDFKNIIIIISFEYDEYIIDKYFINFFKRENCNSYLKKN